MLWLEGLNFVTCVHENKRHTNAGNNSPVDNCKKQEFWYYRLENM
jgi:hypothetical protein